MKAVFADTLYWVATVLPGDPWEKPARAALERLGDPHLVTTDEVLVEFLNALSGHPEYRKRAVRMLRVILESPDVTVVEQSRASLLDGVSLYEQRVDKQYSVTDCISMQVMRSRKLTDVLTNDRHFSQEGFTVLIAAEA